MGLKVFCYTFNYTMSHVCRLFGATVPQLYLACRLAELGLKVEFYGVLPPKRLRPHRLSPQALMVLKALLQRNQRPFFALDQAPQILRWGLPQGHRYGFVWERLFNRTDRWIESSKIYFMLEDLARSLGVIFKAETQAFAAQDSSSDWHVIDIDPETLLTAERQKIFPLARERKRLEVVEFAYNQSPAGQGGSLEFLRLEGSLVICESLGPQSSVMTYVASSGYRLQRSLQAVQQPKGAAPTAWKALHLTNPGAREEHRSISVGEAGFDLAGAYALGQSFGRLHPFCNLELADNLLQAERLVQVLKELPRVGQSWRSAEAWKEQELKLFRRSFRRASMMEKLLFSESTQRLSLQASTYLPLAFRHALKSPV